MNIVTVEAAAQQLGKAKGTIHGWIRDGAPVVEKGRGRSNHTLVSPDELSAWAAQRNPPPAKRKCKGCGWMKTAAEFPQRRHSDTGRPRPSARCRECESSRAREARANRQRPAYKPPIDRERKRRRERLRDPRQQLNHRIHRALSQKLRQSGGSMASFAQLLDFTLEELRVHLAKQFLPGMSWQNYGQWEIDHIVPKDSFRYETPHEPAFKECWSLTNLRPVWRVSNLRKGCRRRHLI